MLLPRLLLLPLAVASTVTIYTQSLPSGERSSAALPAPAPIAQIDYDASTFAASLTSYNPPTGAYTSQHLLRIGLLDTPTNKWKGVVTSAASFADEYRKKFVLHVDERGEIYHVGFGTSGRGKSSTEDNDVEIEIVTRVKGAQPALNKPVILNAEGKIEGKEPEKTFLQK